MQAPFLRYAFLLLGLWIFSGCTHWATTDVYGKRVEVSRRALGEPHMVTSSKSSGSLDVFGAKQEEPDGLTSAVGAADARTESMSRTRCMQTFEVDYRQPQTITPVLEGRALDITLSIVLGVVGAGIYSGAQSSYEDDLEFHERDPNFFDKPSEPTGAYTAGGILIGSGVGLLLYSLTQLPSEPKPRTEKTERRWTDTKLLEATGCGSPSAPAIAKQPTPPPPPAAVVEEEVVSTPVTPKPASSDMAERLRQLKSLKEQGLITEDEYNEKRKLILDQLVNPTR